MKKKLITAAAIAAALAVGLTACDLDDGTSTSKKSQQAINNNADSRSVYVPKNDVEFDNYNKAQKLYDSPDTIIWCTSAWSNASAPLVTTPIRGKLTSSSVSYFPNNSIQKYGSNGAPAEVENRSVDGMYHGTPGPYRYGFTPGGVYVDYTGMEVMCTTALTSFQRQSTTVDVNGPDAKATATQDAAEAALKAGDSGKAAELLKGLK